MRGVAGATVELGLVSDRGPCQAWVTCDRVERAGCATKNNKLMLMCRIWHDTPSYEGSSVKHQNLSLSGRKPNSDLSRRVLRQPRIRWDISSQTTFPYSGEEFFSGGATL